MRTDIRLSIFSYLKLMPNRPLDHIVSGCARKYEVIQNALNKLVELGYVVYRNGYYSLTGKDWDATKAMKKRAAATNRKNPTSQEEALWHRLKGKQLGYSFARQKKLLGYLADFYCQELKLVIEVDGGYHQYTTIHDKKRSDVLKAHGNGVLRVKNDDVDTRLDKVVELIRKAIVACEERKAQREIETQSRPSALATTYTAMAESYGGW